MDVELPEDEGPSPFQRIVSAKTFVDKTKMIEKIVSGPPCIHITAPPLFGKTTNLDMLRKFFEKVTVGANGHYTTNRRLFVDKNLKIASDEVSMHHCGKYVVVYLDCKCTTDLHDYSQMKQLCLKVTHSAYRQHEYLRYSNRIDSKQEVIDWCDPYLWMSFSRYSVVNGLKTLINSLMSHHDPTKDIMVLVDDFDAPLMNLVRNGMFSGPNWFETYLQSKELYLEMFSMLCLFEIRIILSATFRTRNELPYEYDHHYDFLSDETYTPFYGATREEVRDLLVEFHFPENLISLLQSVYGGYDSKYGTCEMYHLHGVITLLQQYDETTRFDLDLSTISFDVNLQPALNNLQAQGILWLMERGRPVMCNYFASRATVEHFLETIPYSDNRNTLSIFNKTLFPLYLMQQGYISYAQEAVPWMLDNYCCALCQVDELNVDDRNTNPLEFPGPCWVKIPNQTARTRLEKFLFDYYSRTFSLSKEDIFDCGIHLANLGPSATLHQFEEFRNALWHLFQTNYFRQDNADAYLAFYPVACSTLRNWEVYQGRDQNSKYVILFREDLETSICIGIHTKDEDAYAALEEAYVNKCTKIRGVNPIMQILCIGINVVPYAEIVHGIRVDTKCALAVYDGPSNPYRATPLFSS